MDFLFAVLGLCAFVLSTLAIIWLIIVMLKQFSSPKTWDGSMLGQPIEQSAHRPESEVISNPVEIVAESAYPPVA